MIATAWNARDRSGLLRQALAGRGVGRGVCAPSQGLARQGGASLAPARLGKGSLVDTHSAVCHGVLRSGWDWQGWAGYWSGLHRRGLGVLRSGNPSSGGESSGKACCGKAGRSMVRFRHGMPMSGQAVSARARRGRDSFVDTHSAARLGRVWLGVLPARRGKARQVLARLAVARLGLVRPTMAGLRRLRLGMAWRVTAGRIQVRPGKVCLGKACHGEARSGSLRQGMMRHGPFH